MPLNSGRSNALTSAPPDAPTPRVTATVGNERSAAEEDITGWRYSAEHTRTQSRLSARHLHRRREPFLGEVPPPGRNGRTSQIKRVYFSFRAA
jgi:hypothetical protein